MSIAVKFKVRTLLVAGFFIVVSLFALATSVIVLSIARIDKLEERLAHLDHAKHEGHLTLVAIQDQYIHQAHTLIAGDRSHLDHYEEARLAAEKRLNGLEAACAMIGIGEGIDDIRKVSAQMIAYFEAEVVQSLGNQSTSKSRNHNAQLDALTQKAGELTANLNARLERKSDESREELGKVLAVTQGTTLTMLSLAILAAVIVGFFLVKRIGQPLSSLHKAFSRIGAGQLDIRVEPEGPRELVDLALGFNDMASALEEGRRRIAQNERMAVMGELAAGVAHELNNPLAVILGYLKLLRQSLSEGQSIKDLDIVEDEVKQCQKIVQGLLDLARPQTLNKRPVDLASLVEETVERLNKTEPGLRSNIAVDVKSKPVFAEVDDSAIRRVVSNLLSNALEAMPTGGDVDISVQEKKGFVVITVSDSGAGIHPEIQADLFKPFRTTKTKGTGLGLAICDVLVKCHDGHIQVSRGPKGGALFQIIIPQGPVKSLATARVE